MNISASSSFVNNMSFNTSMASSFSTSRRGKSRMDSILISSNSTHFLEKFGLPLPSMVKVAITNSTDHQKTTSRLDQNGYAWLVWGRKLYIWRHSQSDKRMTCRELMLPPSELVHNANLVCVVCNNGIPACIAASPEGLITYWPNVFNESMNISISADVPGQECDSLTSHWPTGCILATTSGTVLLLKTVPGKGTKPYLVCSPLPHQKGWLGGFGKKMSVLWYPVAGSNLEMKRAKVIVPPPPVKQTNKEQSNIVYLLLGPLIQTWNITADEQHSMGDINGEDILRKLFFNNVWAVDGDQKGDLRGIQIWLLDLACVSNRKIAVLAAAKNSADSTNIVHFGIAIMDEQKARRIDEIKFVLVNHKVPFSEINDDHLYSWKIYVANNFYYVVSNELLLTVADKDGATDVFDSTTTVGPFLGSGIISGNVVIFVARCGILQVTYIAASADQHMSTLDSTLLEVRVPDHLSLSISHSQGSMNDDNINVYKSAFLNYCGKKLTECNEILINLFPPTVPSLTPHDNIDTWTVGLCQRLIDDAPVSDPRWVSSFGSGSDQTDHLGLKSKILIKNFLMDKKEGLELFFAFLNGTGVLQRLTGTVIKEDVVSTTSVLFNAYEKIGFALALQRLQSDNQSHRTVIDMAVKSIIQSRPKTSRSTNLTPNDLFYKDVSKIHHIIPALLAIEEQALSSKNPTEVTEIIKQTNDIILSAITDTVEQLNDRLENIKNSMVAHLMNGANQYEYIPWLVQSSVLNCLVRQHELTVRFIDVDSMTQLKQISDLILDGLKTNMESLIATDRYHQKCAEFAKMRLNLLKSHIAFDTDGARLLAEKYIDYEILVNICYDLKDFEQLQFYFEKFDDFPEFVFEWYVKHKKHTELLDSFSLGKFSDRLKQFLKRYPQIAWYHMSMTDNFKDAADTLQYLAAEEETYLVDKEFMLCLSTLANLASQDNPNLEQIDRSLELVNYQKGLSDELLAKWGMDRNTMRVLSASEIIDFYTSENEGNVDDFWQAWHVCDFLLNIDLRDEKRLIIITRAILSDPWDTLPTDHPVDVIKTSLLYRFAIGLFGRGEVLDSIFPYEELLQVEEIEHLLNNDNAKFLLSACREHLSFAEKEGISATTVESMEMSSY